MSKAAATSVNMNQISFTQSEVFTFKVGHDQTPFHVHKAIIEAHSSVLAQFMNDGQTQESIDGLSSLKYTEPATFALFIEFAYARLQQLQPLAADKRNQNDSRAYFTMFCHSCDIFLEMSCPASSAPEQCVKCGSYEGAEVFEVRYGENFPKRQPRPEQLPGLRRFLTMFPASQFELLKSFTAADSIELRIKHVWTLAKLLVFTQMYMIQVLPELCLILLNHNLGVIQVREDNVQDIVDIVRFTYTNTCASDEKPDEAEHDIGKRFRVIVMTYAVKRARELVHYPQFKSLMREGGAVVDDFTEGMAMIPPDDE